MVVNSTICANTASGSNGYGGGIYDGYGAIGLYQVTVSGNSAVADGGGVYDANNSSNTVNIYQSTIAQNQASGNGGGLANGYAGTNVAVFNTIIANNTAMVAGPDAKGSFSTSGSHNLIGIVDGSNGLGNDPASKEGTLANPLDAGLGVLTDNGGPTVGDQIHGNGQPTLTQGLLPTSPAISARARSLCHRPQRPGACHRPARDGLRPRAKRDGGYRGGGGCLCRHDPADHRPHGRGAGGNSRAAHLGRQHSREQHDHSLRPADRHGHQQSGLHRAERPHRLRCSTSRSGSQYYPRAVTPYRLS